MTPLPDRESDHGPPEHDLVQCSECEMEFAWDELDENGLCHDCRHEWPNSCDECPDGPDDECSQDCPNQGGK